MGRQEHSTNSLGLIRLEVQAEACMLPLTPKVSIKHLLVFCEVFRRGV
jgi:hypothetical protein